MQISSSIPAPREGINTMTRYSLENSPAREAEPQVNKMHNTVTSSTPSDIGRSTEVIGKTLYAVRSNTPNDASPVAKLYNEILLQIFRINVEMDWDRSPEENKDALRQQTILSMKNIRNSSQVNSLWRSLIINEPLLWANNIDMDYLGRTSEWWRSEIVRRTKDSPLNIRGSIYIPLDAPDNLEQWWMGFLSVNWTRIRKIDLELRSDLQTATQNNWVPVLFQLNSEGAVKIQKALPFLSQSTPTLEYFSLAFPWMCDPLGHGCTFFDNQAPRLTSFKIDNIQLTNQTSWLKRLRALSVHESRAQTFQLGDDLCRALSIMPEIESLSLKNAIIDPSVNVCQDFIHLPRLQHLFITDIRPDVLLRRFFDPLAASTVTYWQLLSRIVPKPGCSVILNLSSSYSGPGKTDVCVLSRLAHNYFENNRPTMLDIVCSWQSCRFWNVQEGDMPCVITGRQPQSPIFNFSCCFNFQDALDLDSMMYQALEAFFELSFPTVTHLRLELTIASPETSLLSCPGMASLLSTFASVEVLTTTALTLRFLSKAPALDVSALFPKLKVLDIPARLENSVLMMDSWEIKLFSIALFLALRQDGGLEPLPTLNYVSEVKEIMDDLSGLDSFAGLKVVWKTETIGDGEYICGSGKPEELNFRQKYEAMMREERE